MQNRRPALNNNLFDKRDGSSHHDLKNQGETALMKAVKEGQFGVVQWLVENHAYLILHPVNANGDFFLILL